MASIVASSRRSDLRSINRERQRLLLKASLWLPEALRLHPSSPPAVDAIATE